MGPGSEAWDDDQSLPIDGFEVEEIADEDTIRLFLLAWRRRVSEEYALSILKGRAEQGGCVRMH